jgi:ADP-ribose pyrophosphatase
MFPKRRAETACRLPPKSESPQIIATGRYLRFVRRGRYEYVERINCTGVVVILSLTDQDEVLLIEQFRETVQGPVIEFPAGLVNDHDSSQESLENAARRELEEETGFKAKTMHYRIEGPVTAGLSTELVSFFEARGLVKVSDGGGDDTEQITVHLVPIQKTENWLHEMSDKGVRIDPKVYAGLYLLKNPHAKLAASRHS